MTPDFVGPDGSGQLPPFTYDPTASWAVPGEWVYYDQLGAFVVRTTIGNSAGLFSVYFDRWTSM